MFFRRWWGTFIPKFHIWYDEKKAWNQSFLLIGLSIVVIFFLFNSTFHETYTIWIENSTYSYGILIPFISLYLVWKKRYEIKKLKPSPELDPFIGSVIGIVICFIGESNGLNSLKNYTVVTILILLVWGSFGNQIFKRLIFPLFFLYFAVPYDPFFNNILIKLTTDIAFEILTLSGFEIIRDHYSIIAVNFGIIITDSGNGFNSMITMVVLTMLIGYHTLQSIKRKMLLVVFAICIVIIMNGIRVCCILYISNLGIDWQVVHYSIGWFLFMASLAIVMWIATFWKKTEVINKVKVEQQFDTPKFVNNLAAYIAILTVIFAAISWLAKIDNNL